MTVTVVGAAEIEKSEGALTVRETGVEWVAAVPVPVTLNDTVPVGVAPVVVIVMVEDAPAVIEAGLNDAVAPLGRPDALKLTLWALPLVTVVEIVDVPLWPAVTVTVVGAAEIEKSSTTGALTVSETAVDWVVEMPVPVTVTLTVPVGVAPVVVIVIVEDWPEVIEAGLNDALAPLGRPDALKLTVWALPLVIVVEIVDVPLWPAVTVTVVGAAEIEKSSTTGALTVSETGVEWVFDAPVPVTLKDTVPVGVAPVVVTVIVEDWPAVIEAGLNDALAPLGRPEALKLTAWALPLVSVVEIVEVPLWPAVTVTVVGAAEIEKSSGTGLTVNETGVECVADALVPVALNDTVPVGVAPVVVIVIVDDWPAVIEAGLNDADAPLGRPDPLSVMLSAAPLVTVVEIVDVPL